MSGCSQRLQVLGNQIALMAVEITLLSLSHYVTKTLRSPLVIVSFASASKTLSPQSAQARVVKCQILNCIELYFNFIKIKKKQQ
jgi:hypothetical protein